MEREKKLVKNTLIVAAGKICTQFISFFLLPLYTSLLSAEEYGTVDLLNTYVALLIPIVFFQIDQAIFRYLIDARENETKKKKLIATTCYIVFIQAILYLLIYFVLARYIQNDYKYFLAVNVVVIASANILLQISRGLGDNITYSQGSLITGASTILLNVLFILFFKFGAYGMLTATAMANIFCILFIIIKKKVYIYLKINNFSKNTLITLWKYSWPLIPNQLSWWIINVSDRLIITYVLGVALNGIYSASNKFSSVCISLFSIFNITWAESASIHINDKDSSNYFSYIMNITVKLFTALCVLIIAFMPFVFRIFITGIDYKSAYYQIPLLMLATIFNIIVSLLGSIYVALKKTDEIAKTSIYSAIINIVINLLLINFIGLYAASLSTFVSYLAMAIYRYIDIQKYVKLRLDLRFLLISIPIIIIIIIIYYTKNPQLCLLGLIVASIYSFVFNKNIIAMLLNTLKEKIIKGGK
ncbi:lipopolysaccharide biosynthesis protein [Turicibacter faecis]|uniref:lipopolysaccharide biosynthesis protein n=1 Tax=Turicibacter faecis TaxID=2963365 RepID=UPI0030D08EF1